MEGDQYLRLSKPGSGTTPPPITPKLGQQHAAFPLPEGSVSLAFPAELSVASAQMMASFVNMRVQGFVIATVALLAATQSYAACTKPQTPSCAIEGKFAKAADQDRCRLQMLPYQGAMEAFAECLKGEGQDEKPALDE